VRKPGWEYPLQKMPRPPRQLSGLLGFVFGCLATLAALLMLGVLP
jgi:hypothetical protein